MEHDGKCERESVLKSVGNSLKLSSEEYARIMGISPEISLSCWCRERQSSDWVPPVFLRAPLVSATVQLVQSWRHHDLVPPLNLPPLFGGKVDGKGGRVIRVDFKNRRRLD